MDEKKKGLAALVIAMKPKAKDGAKEKASGFDVAAGEAYEAAKGGDKAAFSRALKNAVKLCRDED